MHRLFRNIPQLFNKNKLQFLKCLKFNFASSHGHSGTQSHDPHGGLGHDHAHGHGPHHGNNDYHPKKYDNVSLAGQTDKGERDE
jgi:hypothetical protein